MNEQQATPARAPGMSGFTLMEMMIVMVLIVILAGVGLTMYGNSVTRAKEAVLKEDLFRMRDAIDQYYADKGRYPGSLAALVEDGYLRRLPNDPMTQQPDWVEVQAEQDPDSTDPPGIYDVHSASGEVGLNGTPYAEW